MVRNTNTKHVLHWHWILYNFISTNLFWKRNYQNQLNPTNMLWLWVKKYIKVYWYDCTYHRRYNYCIHDSSLLNCPHQLLGTLSSYNICYDPHPTVNKALLLDLFSHSVNVRFWDTKDKVSVRAKFDRPKVFRLPPPPGPRPVDARFDGGKTS